MSIETMTPTSTPRRPSRRWWSLASWSLVVVFATSMATGCTSLLSPINGIPAHRLPPELLATPKNELNPIDMSRLGQIPPEHYLIDKGDVLGVYIEGVLGKEDEPPPVEFPKDGSTLPPSLGFPVPVSEDGTLPLPLIPPLPVKGKTIMQAQEAIRKAYTIDRDLIKAGEEKIIVTLMRERTYSVVVMRQDGQEADVITGGGGGAGGGNQINASFMRQIRGNRLNLPAYQNDVLNALAQTGGLPGLNAKNEVQILRPSRLSADRRDRFVREFYARGSCDPCMCRPPLPPDPAIIRIPLRLPPGETPRFKPSDVILQDGDILLIEGREREVFYTGGLLGGGEYQLPRDYDLDVLGAMAMTGTGVGARGGRQGGGGSMGSMGGSAIGALGGAPPGQLYILRKTPCNDQIIIAVDLTRAINDARSRPLIQAGDTLILRYKPSEELLNFGIGTFFTYGITQLFRR